MSRLGQVALGWGAQSALGVVWCDLKESAAGPARTDNPFLATCEETVSGKPACVTCCSLRIHTRMHMVWQSWIAFTPQRIEERSSRLTNCIVGIEGDTHDRVGLTRRDSGKTVARHTFCDEWRICPKQVFHTWKPAKRSQSGSCFSKKVLLNNTRCSTVAVVVQTNKQLHHTPVSQH